MENGTKVKLNWKTITSLQYFEDLKDEYKQFVLNNKETVFVVMRDKYRKKNSPLISLQYENGTKAGTWLFTEDLLIKQ